MATDDSSRTVRQAAAAVPAGPPPRPKTRPVIMDYLVEFILTIPDDAPPAEIEQRTGLQDWRTAARYPLSRDIHPRYREKERSPILVAAFGTSVPAACVVVFQRSGGDRPS